MSSIQSVAGQPVAPLALEADAPRRAAVGHDLVAQRDQLVPRLGHLVAGRVEVVLRVPDHALEVDVGRHAVVLALVLTERDERLAEQVVQVVDVEARGPRAPRWSPLSTRPAIAPGCGTAATSSVPPSARIWNCSSKSPDGLDLDVVVGLRVDQVVEDLLVGGRPPRARRHSAGSPRRCSPSTRPSAPLPLLLLLVRRHRRRTLRRRRVDAPSTPPLFCPHFMMCLP